MASSLKKNKHRAFEDKIVLVTGGGRGIGKATALLFAREGARVITCSRTWEELAELKKGGSADTPVIDIRKVDISQEESVDGLFSYIRKTYGKLDILVNNAAVIIVTPFEQFSAAEWDTVMNINVRGSFLCSREAFRIMKSNGGGVIINISSLSGVPDVEKFPGFSAYNVSKYGISGLTEICAVEGKPYNIRVCAISPGAVNTRMLKSAAPDLKPDLQPEDVARKILFVADEHSKVVSGTNLVMYG